MTPAAARALPPLLAAEWPAADDTEALTRQLELATLAALSVGIGPRAEPPRRDSPARYPGPYSESPSARERARTRHRTPVMPVLLLPLERPFIPGDMVATLRKLRQSFRVVATCDGGILDPASATVVDHVISLWRDPKGFKHAVREIVRLKPAVELYLTIGGASEVTMLASLRLARAQIFSSSTGDALIEEIQRAAQVVAR